MPTVTFDVPEGALSALRLSPTEFVKQMRLAAALAVVPGPAMAGSASSGAYILHGAASRGFALGCFSLICQFMFSLRCQCVMRHLS